MTDTLFTLFTACFPMLLMVVAGWVFRLDRNPTNPKLRRLLETRKEGE